MMHTLQLAIRILAYPPSYLHNAIVNKFASQNYSVKPSNMQTFQKTSFNRYVEITVANITVGPSSSGMFTNGGVLGELQKT
ncbi:MAG TPA: hypothetical protein VK832_04730, partial [Burkholderiaceae bacterium]|nr:hypothetical protein [Burkholderiaceae bacterium]